jgi:hypothetical protein
MAFWSVRVFPKYLNCSTFSKELFPLFMFWFSPACWSRDKAVYLVGHWYSTVKQSNKQTWHYKTHIVVCYTKFTLHSISSGVHIERQTAKFCFHVCQVSNDNRKAYVVLTLSRTRCPNRGSPTFVTWPLAIFIKCVQLE